MALDLVPGWLKKIMSRPRAAASQGDIAFNTTDHAMLQRAFGAVSTSGKAVNEQSMLGISTAWTCARLLSEVFGAIPWGIYRDDGRGNAVKDDTHPLAAVLLGSPNADMTSVEFRETLMLSLSQAGNAYSQIGRLGPSIISLYPLQARDCRPMRKRSHNTRLDIPEGSVFFRVTDRGKTEDLPQDQIWHVKIFGDGLEGLSPLSAAREAMGFAIAAEEFGARFFGQGGMPAGIVTLDKWLEPDQRVKARENLNQMLGGLANAHKFALFEGGMKPEAWGNVPLKDIEFLLLRQFSVPEICRFYRVPPHMAGDLSRSTNNNIEQQSQEFVTYTMMPYFTRFEASVSKWLLPPRDRGHYFLRFNFEALLRADSKGRSEFYSSAVQNGWMNRNEVRGKENLNRVDTEGMDAFTAQTNLAPVDKLGELADKQATKPAAPAQMKEGDTLIINSMPPAAAPKIDLAPAAVHVRNEGSRIAVQLPETMNHAHAVKHELDLAPIAQLVKETRALARGLAVSQERMESGLLAVATEARRPRKAVFNAAGEPIGTVAVDSLDN